MKKITALFLMLFAFAATMPVSAMSPEETKETRFKEMKAIKDKQRADREAKKAGKSVENGPHQKGFWEKEGERSGLGGSGNRMGTFLGNLNPAPFFKDQDERYKARKSQGQNK